jgi:7-cyano-7-deazaguanine synthase in queuosine biosynthesis
MNDDALSFLEEIKFLWKAFNNFQVEWKTNPIPLLTFPIIKMPKELLMKIASEYYPDIFHKIHFCEFPNEDGSNCERCVSCIKAYDKGYKIYKESAENNRSIKYEIPKKEIKEVMAKQDKKVIGKKIKNGVNLFKRKFS